MKPLLKNSERQKAYEHIVGMFIVTWFLIAFLLALFLAGCKDKVEAKTWSHTDEELPKAVWYFDGKTTIKYLPESDYSIEISDFNAPDDFDIVIEKPEPNELWEVEWTAENWVKTVKLEPNEPIATKIIEGQLFYDKREGIEPEKRMWIFDGDRFNRLDDITTPEPNEPEGLIYIWEPNEPQKVSLDFIPTWPDFIKLEKDLMIIWPNEPFDIDEVQYNYQPQIYISKGTKIYFKDED